MLWFGVRRLARGLLVVLFVSFLVVTLLALAPGSPATVILGENATPEAVADLERQLGLDQPVWVQWWHWIGAAFQGHLGTSRGHGVTVLDGFRSPLPYPVGVGVVAVVIRVG